MSVYEVLDKIMDSSDFTVGGGAASAVAGAMSAGLIGMVSRLSAGKKLGLTDEQYAIFSNELDQISKKLKQGSCDDEAAFLNIKEAFALPKSTEDEKFSRQAVIENAAFVAAKVPLENARMIARVLEIARELEGKFNAAASSDFKCGEMLAKTALIGCALNIDANLPLIKNPEITASLKEASLGLKELVQ